MQRITQKGFTLVELLVVVIMIGVLASVAVPKYFRAVERSRASEAASILAALNQSQERFRQRNNAYATSVAVLDFDANTGTYFGAPTTTNTTAVIARNTASFSTVGHSCTAGYSLTIALGAGTVTASGGGTCDFLLP